MEKMVEVERVAQDELRHDLRALFKGAIRITLEMVLEEEVKAMLGARRFEPRRLKRRARCAPEVPRQD